jgi:hypothetical protein
MRPEPPNKAMKLTKPIQVRAPRHSASHHGAPCRSARSSLMRASQLIAVLGGSRCMEVGQRDCHGRL